LVCTREQAIPVGLAVAFVLAWLGGLFWPIYDLTLPMQEIARVLMTTWSMSAVQDVILRDSSLAGVSTELLAVFAYGLVSFLIAVRLFRYNDGECS
jgi:ABC-type multidrug transport system permease subunit